MNKVCLRNLFAQNYNIERQNEGWSGLFDSTISTLNQMKFHYLPFAPLLAIAFFHPASARGEQTLTTEIDKESVQSSYEKDDGNPCTQNHSYSTKQLDRIKKNIKEISSKKDPVAEDLIRLSKLSRLIGSCTASLKYANEAVSLGKLSSDAYDNRAYIRELLDQRDLALSDISKSLLLNPKNSRSYGLRCNILFRSGNKAAALEDCSKAINLDPNNADYYSTRGLIRLNMGDPKGAIRDYDQAIKIKPSNYSLYQNRGSIKVMNQDYLGSSNDLKQALKHAPRTANTSGIYSTLCLATQNLGDLNKAIEECNKAIEIDQSNSDSYFNRGNIYLSKKQYEKALKDYNQSIKLNPEQDAVANNIAGTLAMLGRNHEAIKIYSTLINKGYDLSGSYKNRAYAWAAVKDYQNALTDINKAIKYSPGDPLLYYWRGNFLFKLGKSKVGCADFNRASMLGMQEISQWLQSKQGEICTGTEGADS